MRSEVIIRKLRVLEGVFNFVDNVFETRIGHVLELQSHLVPVELVVPVNPVRKQGVNVLGKEHIHHHQEKLSTRVRAYSNMEFTPNFVDYGFL